MRAADRTILHADRYHANGTEAIRTGESSPAQLHHGMDNTFVVGALMIEAMSLKRELYKGIVYTMV